jgi:hypothetical protein
MEEAPKGAQTTKHQRPMKNTFLTRFFEEKDLVDMLYEVKATDGMLHLIPTGVVVEKILNAPANEQKKIEGVLRKIDFLNGDVHHFLRHLAQALVN